MIHCHKESRQIHLQGMFICVVYKSTSWLCYKKGYTAYAITHTNICHHYKTLKCIEHKQTSPQVGTEQTVCSLVSGQLILEVHEDSICNCCHQQLTAHPSYVSLLLHSSWVPKQRQQSMTSFCHRIKGLKTKQSLQVNVLRATNIYVCSRVQIA